VLIYDDQKASVNNKIFNKYDTGGITVLDYSLNNTKGNPALTKSSIGSFIGGMRPKVNITFDAPKIIDDNGVEGANGDLIVNDGVTISINTSSAQARNIIHTGVISIVNGSAFIQWQSDFFASNVSGIYLGAKQTLAAGLFHINGVVIIPYNSLTVAANFPKFLAPLNSPAEIARRISDNSIITFNDLAGLGIDATPVYNLTEVGTWAVSNATAFWQSLMELDSVYSDTPAFKYFKASVIVNKFA